MHFLFGSELGQLPRAKDRGISGAGVRGNALERCACAVPPLPYTNERKQQDRLRLITALLAGPHPEILVSYT